MAVVVFDMDGTLVEREGPLAWATECAMKDLGLSFMDASYLYKIHAIWKTEELFNGIDLETQKEIYTDKLIPKMIEFEMTSEFYKRMKLFPNMDKLIQELFKLDYKLMVCTSRDTESTSALMEYLKIRKYFINVIGTQVGRFIDDKPSPAPVHYMMK